MTKTMTLRLPADRAAELEAVARADQVSVSEAARQAIERHIEMRRKDKVFQARIKALVEENRGVLERLAK